MGTSASSICGGDSFDDKSATPNVRTHNTNSKRSNVSQQAPIPRVLIIQNDVLCPPCSAISSLVEHEIAYQVIYAFHELAFKHIHPLMYEAIIVLGGRLSVNDAPNIKWLSNEIDFMKQALKEKVPILGICLGAQLLAKCTGGEVMIGDQGIEIGYEDWIFADDHHEKEQKENKSEIDPFIRALKHKDLDKFVILFHGDTFNLPKKCKLSGQNIRLLAKTETKKYKTLYKVGNYSYGFQGHPELNYDLLQIWCKSWGDHWLKKSNVDLENHVLQYAKKNKILIDQNSKILFDIWIEVALLSRKDTIESDQSIHTVDTLIGSGTHFGFNLQQYSLHNGAFFPLSFVIAIFSVIMYIAWLVMNSVTDLATCCHTISVSTYSRFNVGLEPLVVSMIALCLCSYF